MGCKTPAEIAKTYSQASVARVSQPLWRMFFAAVMGGIFISFAGAVTSTAAHAHTNVSVIRLVTGLLFGWGLSMAIITGCELYNGNCMLILPIMQRRIRLCDMLKTLATVYAGNWIGSLLVALGCAFSGQFNYSDGGLAVYTIKLAAAKCALPFGNGVILGLLCNLLVCAGVLMSIASHNVTGKILSCFITVGFFVVAGFENSVANMYYVPAGLFAMMDARYAALALGAGVDTSALSWSGYLLGNLLPVSLGNLIAGLILGLFLWACHSPTSEGSGASADAGKDAAKTVV